MNAYHSSDVHLVDPIQAAREVAERIFRIKESQKKTDLEEFGHSKDWKREWANSFKGRPQWFFFDTKEE